MDHPCLPLRQGEALRHGPGKRCGARTYVLYGPLCDGGAWGSVAARPPSGNVPPLDAAGAASYKGAHARMVELVDTRDLKSLGHRLCRFKPGSGYQNKKSRCRPVCDGFFRFSSSPSPAGKTRSQKEKPGGHGSLTRGIVQARARPNINKRWPRKRPPPGRFHHAGAACRKGCPASPARPRPAGPASSSVRQRAASRSPPNDKRPPLRG